MSIAEAFSLALRYQQSGNLLQAEQLCRQVIAAAPGHADAHHLLGVLSYQSGRFDEAVTFIRRALVLNPGVGVCHTNLGMAHEALGQLDEAVANYEQALRIEPDAAEAHNNLGNVLRQQNKLPEAVDHCRQAVQLLPSSPEALNNLGNALLAQGKLEEAVDCLRRAIHISPCFAQAYNNLGTALTEMDQLDDAVKIYRVALRINTDYAEAHYNLGLALQRQDKLGDSIACYREAVRLEPDFARACQSLASALFAQDKIEESILWYHQALRLDPNNAQTLTDLGNSLARQDKLDDAIRCHRQALLLDPECPEAHTNLGNVLAAQDNLEEAARCHEEALRVKPEFVAAWTNLGSVRSQQSRFDEALVCYGQALNLEPEHVQTHFNRSLVHLLLGDWDSGWPEYEWRWKTKGYGRFAFQQPRWDGSPLPCRTILVFAEQGFGDTLQFIRYLPLIKERGGRVILQCQPRLIPLLVNAKGIDQLLPRGEQLPAFDVYAPLLSLPGIFGTSLSNVPADVAYLQADARLVEDWRSKLRGSAECGVRSAEAKESELTPHSALRTPHFLIGIAWQGTATYRGDRQRSIPLAQFQQLAKIPGVQLMSLQKGQGTEQLESWGRGRGSGVRKDEGGRMKDESEKCRIHPSSFILHAPILTPSLDESSGAFMDTAAVMMNLDLVIASDTAVPHLAGALGVPVWVALSLVPDWRWQLHGEESPWYPTMCLFRQTRYGQWEDVFERMAEALEQRMKEEG